MEVKQSESGVWVGEKHPLLYHPNASLGYIILDSLYRHPEVVSIIEHESKTQKLNSELRRDIIRVALNFQTEFGISKNDVISVACKNSVNIHAIIVGALCIGAPIHPVDPILNEDEITKMYIDTKPKLIICEHESLLNLSNVVQKLNLDCKILTIENMEAFSQCENIEALIKEHPEEKLFRAPDLGDTNNVIGATLCSSGSTGDHKLVSLPQAVMIHCGRFMDYPTPLFKLQLNFSTLFWASGWLTSIAALMNGSSRVITSQPFSPELAVEIINEHKVDSFMSTPRRHILFTDYLVEHNLTVPSLKRYDLIGARASEKHIRLMKELLPHLKIGNFYGSTETYSTLARSFDITHKYSAGKVSIGIEIKIVDDDEHTLSGNVSGNIYAKTGFKTKYYKNPELTKLSFSEDGWYRTGDTGYFDSDGDLHIGDREKDTFKYNNVLVNPLEIEKLIMAVDGISMVSVVGIPMHDSNKQAAAFVVKSKDSKVTKEDILYLVKSSLSSPKWLHGGVFFVNGLPTTISGKISRTLLLKMIEEGKIVEILSEQ